MTAQRVVGLYDTMAWAEEAVHTLDQAGFPVKQVSIVTQNLVSDKTMHGYITPGDDLSVRGAARARQCGTVVVGREALHGLRARLTSPLSETLIRQAHDLTVWVVE